MAVCIASLTLILGACQAGAEPLTVTPVIYEAGLDPFAHVPPHRQTPAISVFYATGRAPEGPSADPRYGTEVSPVLRLGSAAVAFGDEDMDWRRLRSASLDPDRDEEIPIRLRAVQEIATLAKDGGSASKPLSRELMGFRDRIESELEHAVDRDILIYVHGANVGFYRCTARTAELAHFAGRDFPCIVFDWPSHPNILSYAIGSDHERAEASSTSLADLVAFLAHHTTARRIHILCYSAGGIVTSRALSGLRRASPYETPEALRKLYRLGVVMFAAADVPLDLFLSELRDIHDVAHRLTITVSDADTTLALSATLLGGGQRLGVETEEVSPEERALLHEMPRVEILDVSAGKEQRGFDIGGHHYWYSHPWVLSEVILNIRTDTAPLGRGLTPTECERFWALPADYPLRAQKAAERHLREW